MIVVLFAYLIGGIVANLCLFLLACNSNGMCSGIFLSDFSIFELWSVVSVQVLLMQFGPPCHSWLIFETLANLLSAFHP